MNQVARLSLVDGADADLSIVAQCRLLKVARSTLYYRAAPVSADDLRLMRRLDEQYLATPFYGSRRMVVVLRREGEAVNRKRVRRLMRLMGLEAIYQKPNTSRRHPEHTVYPYLLRDNWLRVSGTTKMPQVDKRICHQLHAIVPLLDELEPQ